ncbi:MAG: MBL fold metallo-hydrolase [Candidatus Ornithospirochaeta sp.]|nr:MBL fold metallo-hydrolase [Candidatus Ornithospirochaeta sp.]
MDSDFFRFPERNAVRPFRIAGNLFFAGDSNVSVFIISTEEGLIMIDTGYATAQAYLIDSIYQLGFDPRDIRIILHSHGHHDHIGATRLLKALSGAELCLGWRDAEMFRTRPELALCSLIEPFADVELFDVDRELHDGDIIRLGGTEILALETPGHSEGCMSYFLTVTEDGKEYRVGLFGGAGLNTMTKDFYSQYGVSGYRKEFKASLSRIIDMDVDIALGTHCGQFEFADRMKRVNEDRNPFIDSTLWRRSLEKRLRMFTERLEENPDERIEEEI